MNDLEAFLADTVRRHATATTAVRNGDATPLIGMLSMHDPVTLFPASQASKVGWAEVSEAFGRVAALYSSGTPVEFEVLAAGVIGDLAYVVGFERGSAAVGGGSPERVNLRVTQIYRREDEEWKLVHRHGDPGPGGRYRRGPPACSDALTELAALQPPLTPHRAKNRPSRPAPAWCRSASAWRRRTACEDGRNGARPAHRLAPSDNLSDECVHFRRFRRRSESEGSMKSSIPIARWRSCKFARTKNRRHAGILQSPLTDSAVEPLLTMEVVP